jgi:acetoin utilization deacetylase AcuC-like enzyme
MLVVYSPDHELHCPETEMLMGHFIPFRECKQRVLNILDALDCQVIAPSDHGLDPILKVHTQDYITHLQNAYKHWISNGGNPKGVFPDTFAVRLEGQYCFPPTSGKEGYYAFDLTTVIVDGELAH